MAKAIRSVAAKGRPFTRLDVPGWPAANLTVMLCHLCRIGELVRLRSGRPGKTTGTPATYQISGTVRPATTSRTTKGTTP